MLIFFAHCNINRSINEDKVMCYAVQILLQGLLHLEFRDAIKEGDGHRIIHCWRYFMLVFKAR